MIGLGLPGLLRGRGRRQLDPDGRGTGRRRLVRTRTRRCTEERPALDVRVPPRDAEDLLRLPPDGHELRTRVGVAREVLHERVQVVPVCARLAPEVVLERDGKGEGEPDKSLLLECEGERGLACGSGFRGLVARSERVRLGVYIRADVNPYLRIATASAYGTYHERYGDTYVGGKVAHGLLHTAPSLAPGVVLGDRAVHERDLRKADDESEGRLEEV
jgi:hypothetical protein